MNQRLVWNFEFGPGNIIPLSRLEANEKDDLKWEVRYFWPDEQTIVLNNIDNGLLNLANYERKFKDDCYYLLPDNDFNIKLRRNEVQYKPLIQQVNNVLGFGHKIILDKQLQNPNEEASFTSYLQQLAKQIKQVGIGITVKKESYTYKFPTNPPIRLELSRLEIDSTVYFSICIEGKSLFLVETLSNHLLDNQISCDYVHFLKKIVKP
jgi:hypothetical protein